MKYLFNYIPPALHYIPPTQMLYSPSEFHSLQLVNLSIKQIFFTLFLFVVVVIIFFWNHPTIVGDQ